MIHDQKSSLDRSHITWITEGKTNTGYRLHSIQIPEGKLNTGVAGIEGLTTVGSMKTSL